MPLLKRPRLPAAPLCPRVSTNSSNTQIFTNAAHPNRRRITQSPPKGIASPRDRASPSPHPEAQVALASQIRLPAGSLKCRLTDRLRELAAHGVVSRRRLPPPPPPWSTSSPSAGGRSSPCWKPWANGAAPSHRHSRTRSAPPPCCCSCAAAPSPDRWRTPTASSWTKRFGRSPAPTACRRSRREAPRRRGQPRNRLGHPQRTTAGSLRARRGGGRWRRSGRWEPGCGPAAVAGRRLTQTPARQPLGDR
jgi:hypothetical protein